MQNAKDSFYEVLRGRLAALNSERTVVVRGITRPGLLVDENETESAAPMADCFHLRWVETEVAEGGAMPLVSMDCEISYATAGTGFNGGLDRGRSLASMDGELLGAVRLCPRNAVKNNYSALASGGVAVAMGTRVWWSDVTFGPVKVNADRLTRVASIQVMSYQEAGEL